jgi:tRNA/tmRNA/rRNA uracil-C5-methylase (TrmA/RlmC/RlmD family)
VTGLIDLQIERPVAGGRMLARHEGQVVFVSGAIPGERVQVRVERRVKNTLFATTVEVLEASADRREPICDAACGGLSFAHVQYARQLALKSAIVADAFHRIARMTLPAPAVSPSPETGYRLRARLHVRKGRPGFFREGTHDWCDAGPTGQLLPDSLEAATDAVRALGADAVLCEAVVVSENVAATERALLLEPVPDGRLPARADARTEVSDTAGSLFGADPPIDAGVTWTRHVRSFFQGNRYLTGDLVRYVLALAPGDRCLDLYAGVGLFAVALAARGSRVVAVEGDEFSARDLAVNAEPWGDRLRTIRAAVEEAGTVDRLGGAPDVVVLDPPRTGLSPRALQRVVDCHAPRVVYVSCDPPTLARDAAALAKHGFVVESVQAFDLFPNTPHVEAVVSFTSERPAR